MGIEYCKAIRAQNAPLTPLALPRWGAAHGGAPGWHAGTAMASASYLRAQPVEAWAPYVPPAAQALYTQARADGLLLSPARLETALLALLRARPAADFAAVRGVSAEPSSPRETLRPSLPAQRSLAPLAAMLRA